MISFIAPKPFVRSASLESSAGRAHPVPFPAGRNTDDHLLPYAQLYLFLLPVTRTYPHPSRGLSRAFCFILPRLLLHRVETLLTRAMAREPATQAYRLMIGVVCVLHRGSIDLLISKASTLQPCAPIERLYTVLRYGAGRAAAFAGVGALHLQCSTVWKGPCAFGVALGASDCRVDRNFRGGSTIEVARRLENCALGNSEGCCKQRLHAGRRADTYSRLPDPL